MENDDWMKRSNPDRWVKIQRAVYAGEIEKENPGYLEENVKLKTIVYILTGIYVMYGVFYMFVGALFDTGVFQGALVVFQSLFFLMWFMIMLNSGKITAVLLLCFRLYAILTALSMLSEAAAYTPFIVLLTFVIPVIIDVLSALFCAYRLASAKASKAIRLNVWLRKELVSGDGYPGGLGQKAAYHNDFAESGDGEENGNDVRDDSDFS